MKTIFSLLLFAILGSASIAQHCQYDHSALIGIRPFNQNNEMIEGLRITLVDENGKPIMIRKDVYEGNDKYIGYKNDTATFWQNPKLNKDISHKKRNEESRHFMQAETDYIFITYSLGNKEKGRYVKIEDIDGAANGGYFSSKTIYVKPEQVQGLCGYPDERKFLEQYQPVSITLEKTILRVENKNTKFWNGFRMEFDHSPLLNCPECKGCYCELLQVFNPNNAMIYEEVLMGNNLTDNDQNIDSIGFDDYNFDRIPDLRFYNNRLKFQNILLFDQTSKTYQNEPLLSRMVFLTIHPTSKTLTGIIFDTIAHSNQKNIPGQGHLYGNVYHMKGQNLINVQIISMYNDILWNGYQPAYHDSFSDKKDTAYFNYVNKVLTKKEELSQKPKSLKIDNGKENPSPLYSTTQLATPFTFVLEKNTPVNALPAEKGYYANKILVYNQKDNNLIYSMVAVGNKLKESAGCGDSLQIADYNFDGSPDFRVCNISMPGKHTYYIYHQKRDTFLIETTLTELNGLIFDFENKTAKGNTNRKEYGGYPWDSPYQYYMETLLFEGSALENLTVTTTTYGEGSNITAKCKYINQKRMYEGDTIGLEIQRKNLLRKEVGPFKFEIEFNPEEYKTSGEKGAYVKILNIFQGNRNVGHFEMYGNYLKEVPHWLDSMEIADFNFDGYPDIRMYYSQLANGKYVYLLFNPEKEVQVFYQDTYFSSLMDAEFIPKQKIMKGKILEANQTLFFFLKNDTLTITTQDKDLSKPPYIEESIYKNGNRRTLRSTYGKLEPEIKKEYGDYNFDGFEDFRQQSKKSPYFYDAFIYIPEKETFEKDTILSKFEIFNYNKHEKTLNGYFRIRTDETTWQTQYYQWSFSERKMVLYQMMNCYSKTPNSESYRCVTSKLVNGKWIDTETFGAE